MYVVNFSFLSNVYMLDYKMLPGSTTDCPSRRAFVEEVLPQLDKLKEIVLEEGQHQNGNGNTGMLFDRVGMN